jgi:prepilin-type N-terminal cleavage/methylation domain-containing protein
MPVEEKIAMRTELLLDCLATRSERGRRAAFTLVEMIATLAILTVLAMSTYQLLDRMNATMRVTAKHDLAVQEAYRLATAFRGDARGATAAELVGEGRGIRFTIGERRAEYHLTADGVTYLVSDLSESPGLARRDLFRYPIDDSLRCRITSDPEMVVLPLAASRDLSEASSGDFRRRGIEIVGVMR